MHIFSIVPTCSGGIDEDVVVVGRDSPVLGVIVLLGVVFLVVGEEGVKLEALLEVLDGFEASDVLEEVEVTVSVNTSTDKSVPVDTLELHVGVIFLEREVKSLSKVDVGSLDGVHVFTGSLKLVEIEVFGENLHLL